MPQALLSERSVARWFRANHPSPAGQREAALAARLGPTVDRGELEDVCGDHLLEEQRRMLLLVGTLLVRHGYQAVWRQVYAAVEEVAEPDGETRLLAELTAAARAGQL
jgi:hypothetical protein